jgi:protein O-GlcNAc transferase
MPLLHAHNPQALVQQAIQLFQQGQHAEAEAQLLKILAAHPKLFDVLHALGVIRAMQSRPLEAIDYFRKALSITRNHAMLQYNVAKALSEVGLDTEALIHHKKATELAAGSPEVWLNYGISFFKLGRYAEAQQVLERALALNPQQPDALLNLGATLSKLDRHDDALALYDRAAQLTPNRIDIAINRGKTLQLKGCSVEALQQFDAVLAVQPDYLGALTAKAQLLVAQGHFSGAIEIYNQALQIQPHVADTWAYLSMAYKAMDRSHEAIETAQHAIELQAGHVLAWVSKGQSETMRRQMSDALVSFEKAHALAPMHEYLAGYRLLARLNLCDWRDFAPQRQALIDNIQRNHRGCVPWDLLSLTDDPSPQLKSTQLFAARWHTSDASDNPNSKALASSSEKIRIGFFSTDFRTHPVGLLLIDLLETLDRNRFELLGFALRDMPSDPVRQRVALALDHYLDVSEQSDEAIAQLAHTHQLHIALDLNGPTSGGRPGIFAHRAAPIQASYLGYAGTSGSSFIDHLIADKVVCPPENLPHYSEKLVWLPHCFMPHDSTQAISERSFTRAEFGLPESGFVFCCFNNHYKLNPTTFDVWMRLLKSAPGSVLWLSDAPAEVKDNLAREAKSRGVDAARIVYAPRMPDMAEHLARYRLADLFIDTFPYNAHTTACDALWAGVPVLTYAGRSFASRVAASLLQAVGLPELVTHSLADYEALALALARDPQRLAALRERLAANRLSTPLFDTPALARQMEAAFSTMIERHQLGQPPALIDLTTPALSA